MALVRRRNARELGAISGFAGGRDPAKSKSSALRLSKIPLLPKSGRSGAPWVHYRSEMGNPWKNFAICDIRHREFMGAAARLRSR